ncbi:MAG TPA: epoxide hydrolase [Candidatus Saccharimonadales bacterium]
MNPQPFSVNVTDAVLEDLRYRLEHSRFPFSQNKGWKDGASTDYIKDAIKYWAKEYDWRKAEAEINSFSHYTVEIDGVKIHYIHQKSKRPNAQAILLTHGWPDSFYRYHSVIGRLVDEYDVIVPSLPGYGFSEKKAMNSKAIAGIWAKLMRQVLGYDSFFASGGDTGAPVTIELARQFPDAVKAIHLTDVGWANDFDQSNLSVEEQKFQEETSAWYWSEGAYTMMHATKPLTVAYGLNDSPAALAAWAASFANRGKQEDYVDTAFGDRDAFITNLMIYWITETAGSAMQMYREEANAAQAGEWGEVPKTVEKCNVPVALTIYHVDAHVPQAWAERQGLRVKRYEAKDIGGHFAAMEIPEVFAEDLKTAFRTIA